MALLLKYILFGVIVFSILSAPFTSKLASAENSWSADYYCAQSNTAFSGNMYALEGVSRRFDDDVSPVNPRESRTESLHFWIQECSNDDFVCVRIESAKSSVRVVLPKVIEIGADWEFEGTKVRAEFGASRKEPGSVARVINRQTLNGREIESVLVVERGRGVTALNELRFWENPAALKHPQMCMLESEYGYFKDIEFRPLPTPLKLVY